MLGFITSKVVGNTEDKQEQDFGKLIQGLRFRPTKQLLAINAELLDVLWLRRERDAQIRAKKFKVGDSVYFHTGRQPLKQKITIKISRINRKSFAGYDKSGTKWRVRFELIPDQDPK